VQAFRAERQPDFVHSTPSPLPAMDRAVRVYAETVTTAIRKIELPTPGIGKLRSDALADGYDFMEALFEDWATGANRFDAAVKCCWAVSTAMFWLRSVD